MGPLAGIKVVEFAGIGPGPFAAMLLADLGASVIRLERTEPSGLGIEQPARFELLMRNRPSVRVDLKRPDGVALALKLLEDADALIEGFRPGTMERLGLGPDEVLGRNPRLVYGRMTGFGQTGPLSRAAGHDLNYIALTGALDAIGRAGAPPTPPLNLVGDFAGGSLYLVVGMLAAILECRTSGRGQVVDAAITDGTSHLMTLFHGLAAAGLHHPERGTNVLDSGAANYDVYPCRDGLYVSIAPIEAKFCAELLRRLGLEAKPGDPDLRERIGTALLGRTRAEWCEVLEGTDACFAPVLSLAEAPDHPHNVARETFVTVDGVRQPAPAPRFSRTPAADPEPADHDGRSALSAWGLPPGEIDGLTKAGTIRP